jgi:hypothetical protein
MKVIFYFACCQLVFSQFGNDSTIMDRSQHHHVEVWNMFGHLYFASLLNERSNAWVLAHQVFGFSCMYFYRPERWKQEVVNDWNIM